MALIKCKECGHQVSSQAAACPSCGAPVPKPVLLGRRGWIGLSLFALVGGAVFLYAPIHRTEPAWQPKPPAPEVQGWTPPPHLPPPPDVKLAVPGQQEWWYGETVDSLGGGRIKRASIKSTNEVTFDAPYGKPQRASLELRIHPRFGKDVILSIERGQFTCPVRGCTVSVSADDGLARKVAALEPADHSSTALFLQPYGSLVETIKKAKRLYVEATVFQEGNRVFEFNVEGLKW